MKKLKLCGAGVLVMVGALVPFLYSAHTAEVFIPSRESKTVDGGPVYNRIRHFSFKDKDVWMMNQSHHGRQASPEQWDRLAIVVDKTTSPKTARYLQLEPGPLEWNENLKTTAFRVSCFMCHANGPRAIRPALEASPSLWQKLQIALWNRQMKNYGRVVLHPDHARDDAHLETPVAWRHAVLNEPLTVAICTRCHNDKHVWSRGPLLRQHSLTIRFMVEQGLMPPKGAALSAKEKQQLDLFLTGL